MENKTMSTSFQSEAKDFNEEMKLTQNTAYQPVVKTDTSTEEAMYSDLHDYSDYQLPKANVKDTKPPQQPVQYTVGKKSFAAIIILLVIIIFLLVAILVLNLISKDTFMSTCTSNASSNSAGLTNSGNTAINCNLSLMQDTMNSIIQQIMVHANNTNRSTEELLQLLNTSLIKDISIPTAAAVNDVLLIVNELLEIQNGSSLFNIRLVSCEDIKAAHPNSPSGYYYVNSRNTYCNMGELCGQDGGWTRIAYLDMNDSSQNCPSGLQELMTGGIRVCRREGDSAGCRSNIFQTNGISYSQICGKVAGYQKGTTDAVYTNININSAYIDGVSITRGSPRQHVWSYIAGYQSNINIGSACPCNTGATSTVQSFVGEHYYCESGTNSAPSHGTVYTTDPLWDGNNCPSVEAPCCNGTGLLWFFRDYGNATITDYIELRVCGNQGYEDEDTPVQLYEIYVK
ncbi:PREDICTED: uncharacterized protein LOC109588296 [Amphimedon queenslandica]|uniref:Fibrinogen C-terminal domain-containing protein n=5 Tax=Amphimedon queenslandica TaxID=400682 RepID=A0AAN0JSE1_AMPQE|nr:PREDICTED: uncharacterized protein LOC109588296 [Amphimedon queenslandica]|eukprot:XP_019860023.1 PREDICTED: uncharacterized protein LOC109588296 [Amphimedon queenslandica]